MQQISWLLGAFPEPFPKLPTIFGGSCAQPVDYCRNDEICLEKLYSTLTMVVHAGLCQPLPRSVLSGIAALRLQSGLFVEKKKNLGLKGKAETVHISTELRRKFRFSY